MSEARLTYQCVDAEYVRTDSNNKPWYRAVIVTNDPDPDITGIDPAEVRGFPDNAGLAAGSIIMYPDDQHKIVYTDTSMTPGPDPEEDEVMVINVTFDSTANTLTLDKTVEEIDAEIAAGKIARTTLNLSDETATDRLYGYVSEVAVFTAGGGEVRVIMSDMKSTPTSKMNVVDVKFEQAAGEGNYPVYQMQA